MGLKGKERAVKGAFFYQKIWKTLALGWFGVILRMSEAAMPLFNLEELDQWSGDESPIYSFRPPALGSMRRTVCESTCPFPSLRPRPRVGGLFLWRITRGATNGAPTNFAFIVDGLGVASDLMEV